MVASGSVLALFGTQMAKDNWGYWKPPNIKMEFFPKEPYINYIQVVKNNRHYNGYQFRLFIKNEPSDAKANNCKAKLIEIWHKKEDGKFYKEEKFEPLDLLFDQQPQSNITNINPGDSVPVIIANVFDENYQKEYFTGRYKIDPQIPQFIFNASGFPIWTYPFIDPGEHQFKIKIFCENSPPIEQMFDLVCSGKWSANQWQNNVEIEDMIKISTSTE
jgi:hypothetical protein